MVNKLITLQKGVGSRLSFAFRRTSKALIALIAIGLLTLSAQSASAAEVTAVPTTFKSADPLGDLIGCPNLGWLSSAQGATRSATGMIGGFILLAFLVILFIAGVSMLLAGKRSDKMQAGFEQAKNASIGLAFTLIGIPILVGIAWGAVLIFNPNCH